MTGAADSMANSEHYNNESKHQQHQQPATSST